MTQESLPSPTHLHLDAVGGAAGDMFVAALLDAFPSLAERVFADVRAVLPPALGAPVLAEGFSSGIRALRFSLPDQDAPSPVGAYEHDHVHHGHATGMHSQGETDAGCHPHDELAPHHGQDHDAHHHGAGFGSLLRLISEACLSQGTATEAAAILTILAEAESAIHGVPVPDVHFHEVGDWDSLMDVVAAGSIIAALRPSKWTVSDLPRGGGLVKTAHGMLPVPAPATARILTGFCWRDDGVPGERVTPTGAAIIRHLYADAHPPAVLGALVASGTGAGTRQLSGVPNVLRVLAYAGAAASGADQVVVIIFDVDDMTGEEIGIAANRLRGRNGVLDLSLQMLVGKKNRPVTRFELLVLPSAEDQVAEACFTETSTIGLRKRVEQRAVLPRRTEMHGSLRVKRVERPGQVLTSKVESDDLVDTGSLVDRREKAWSAAQVGGTNGNE